MQRRILTAATIATVLGSSLACGSARSVRDDIYSTDRQIAALWRSAERGQERQRRNDVRVSEVDRRAEQMALRARDAEAIRPTDTEVSARAPKRLLYEVVLTENDGHFDFGSVKLPETTRRNIDRLIDQLKTDLDDASVEIEGHTDSVGSKTVNDYVGWVRAETVKQYLHEQHGVPLHKMTVISYGKERPIAPNGTREGRAQNRRVVIRVIA